MYNPSLVYLKYYEVRKQKVSKKRNTKVQMEIYLPKISKCDALKNLVTTTVKIG